VSGDVRGRHHRRGEGPVRRGSATEYPTRYGSCSGQGLPEDDGKSVADARAVLRGVRGAHEVPEDSAVVYAVPTIDNEAGVENLRSVIEGLAYRPGRDAELPRVAVRCDPRLRRRPHRHRRVFISINMGSTTLEACAYRRGEQLSPFSTGSVTGNEVDRRIVAAVEEESQGRVHIDRTTAREYKEEHADVYDFEPFTDVIQQPGGGSHEFTVDRGVREPVDRYIDEAVDVVANEFLPELANDHMKPYQLALGRPIAATGGMACIPGLTEGVRKAALGRTRPRRRGRLARRPCDRRRRGCRPNRRTPALSDPSRFFRELAESRR